MYDRSEKAFIEREFGVPVLSMYNAVDAYGFHPMMTSVT